MFTSAWGTSLNVMSLLKLSKYKINYAREHSNEFKPHGILVFSGRQGNGKTLTAVRYVKLILNAYPNAIVVSNINIKGVNVVPYKGLDTLKNLDNGSNGIIFFCDEISNQFNSLGSKDISPEWFEILNMQRKRHLHIVGTCPILARVNKAFREQFDCICTCEQLLFGLVQSNHYYQNNMFAFADGQDITKGLVHKKWQLFTINPQNYFDYDSFEIVNVVNEKKEGVNFYGHF